jgi:hypothetical protein
MCHYTDVLGITERFSEPPCRPASDEFFVLASVIRNPICKHLFQVQSIQASDGKVGGPGEE